MYTAILYIAGSLPLLALLVLEGAIAHTVLPPRLLAGVRGRAWSVTEFAIVLAPGAMALLLGLVLLQGALWPTLCGLAAVMLLSWLAIWALGRRWPHLSLSQKTARLFLAYLVVAFGAAVPTVAGSDIHWTHLRGLLALAVLVVFLLVSSAGALLGVGGATVYLAVVGEIVRSLLSSPPAVAVEEETGETPGQPEALPAEADFEEPDSRSA